LDDTITTIYCLCDDFLKAIDHRDDPQVRLTTAEVMSVPLVAAAFFGGNVDKTRRFLHEYGYMPNMISANPTSTAASTPSSLRRGGLSFRCWPKPSRNHPTTRTKRRWWTPCP
jgi:hypothetical protein